MSLPLTATVNGISRVSPVSRKPTRTSSNSLPCSALVRLVQAVTAVGHTSSVRREHVPTALLKDTLILPLDGILAAAATAAPPESSASSSTVGACSWSFRSSSLDTTSRRRLLLS